MPLPGTQITHGIEMNQNYFVGIGAPRSGTTWLANYLKIHPQVCFSPIKELHFFDSVYRPDLCSFFNGDFISRIKRAVRDLNDCHNIDKLMEIRHLLKRIEMINEHSLYKTYFQELIKDEVVFGEITPSYVLLDRLGYQGILNMYPNAKFVLLIRNPVDRYWSNLKFFQRLHGIDFFSARDHFKSKLHDPKLYLRSDYERTLSELQKVVSCENIKVIFYENLFGTDGQRHIKDLTDFLSIDYLVADLSEVINPTFKENLSHKMRMEGIAAFKTTYNYILNNYVDSYPDSWMNDILSLKSNSL